MSYRRKLILIFMLVNIIPLTLAYSFFSFRFFNTRRDELISTTRTRIENGATNLNTTLWEHSQQLQIIRRHPRLQSLLRSPIPLYMSTIVFDFYFDLQNLFHAIGDVGHSWNLTIFSLNPNVLSGTFIRNARYMEAKALALALEQPEAEYIWTVSDCGNYLYILRPETTLQGHIFAIVQMSLSFNRMRQYFAWDYPEGTLVLLYINSDTGFSIPLFGGNEPDDLENYYMLPTPVLNGGYIVGYLPKSYLTTQLFNPIMGLTAGYFAVIIMFALLTILISRLLARRLENLVVGVSHDINKLVENDNIILLSEKSDEFARINDKFHELVIEIKRYYEENARMETEKKALELELLQSLINPHFLYNSLGSIKSAFHDKQLDRIIDALIQYYRIALNKGNDIISINDEMEMVRLYIEIYCFAYETKLKLDIQMDKTVGALLMPKNTLQPFVENALMHGMKRTPQDCIEIKSHLEGGFVYITVTDNGAGMTPERLEAVKSDINTDLRDGYGLFNVRERVKLFYGEDCDIELASTKGEGTVVTLKIKPGGLH